MWERACSRLHQPGVTEPPQRLHRGQARSHNRPELTGSLDLVVKGIAHPRHCHWLAIDHTWLVAECCRRHQ
ncbi:hypothetical protein C7A07_14915 [Pseudomonas fragi]|nr:hypothetical protein C7A07_14915 [Pseudomonas fragi]